MALFIRSLNDSPFSYSQVISLIKTAFKQWEETGLNSSLLKMTEEDLEKMALARIIVVAYDSQSLDLIGTMTYSISKNNSSCYVSHLAVDPRSSGRGIATQLYGFVLERIKKLGIAFVLSDTSVHAERSIKWHLKVGFKIIGLTSFQTNNYYSYIFRHQISHSIIWNCPLFIWSYYQISRLKTVVLLKADGTRTSIGRIVYRLFKQ